MIAQWMLYSLATSAALFAGACAADYVGRAFNRSTRTLWLAAMIGSIALAARAAMPGTRVAPIAHVAVSVTRSAASMPSPMQETRETGALAPGNAPTTRSYQQLRDMVASPRLASLDRPLFMLAGASTAITLAYLIFSFVRLRRLARRFETRDLDGHTILVSRTLGPALLGVFAPRIVMPEWIHNLSSADRRLILAHELRHVAARDPLLSLASSLVVALQPWNIGLWLMRARLRLAIETDCDRRVLGETRDVRRYAELLIAVHERTMSGLSPMVAFVRRPSNLEWRVRQMTRRRARDVSARTVLASAASAVLIAAACTTPEPTTHTPSRATSNATLSSITGGGRCMSMRADGWLEMFDEMRALARIKYPAIVAANDSTDVIGFVLDEDCNVRRDTLVKMPPPPWKDDAVFRAVSGIEIGQTPHGKSYLNGMKTPGSRRGGPTIAYVIEPSESWRARRANDLCGFGARSDDFCGGEGAIAMRLVDSTRLVIAVRSKTTRDSTVAPIDHYFLVTSLHPFPDSLTRRIRFGRIMYQRNAVYVENRVTTDSALVFGATYAPGFAEFRMPRITYDSLIGIAHYASPGVTIDNIDRLRPAATCDGPLGSCYEVAGKRIEFPG